VRAAGAGYAFLAHDVGPAVVGMVVDLAAPHPVARPGISLAIRVGFVQDNSV
jgi:hypothetical protein